MSMEATESEVIAPVRQGLNVESIGCPGRLELSTGLLRDALPSGASAVQGSLDMLCDLRK